MAYKFYHSYPIEEVDNILSWLYNNQDKEEVKEIKNEVNELLKQIRSLSASKGNYTKSIKKTEDKKKLKEIIDRREIVNRQLGVTKIAYQDKKRSLNMYKKNTNFKVKINFNDFGVEFRTIKYLMNLKDPGLWMLKKLQGYTAGMIKKARGQRKSTKGLYKLEKAIKSKIQNWKSGGGGKVDIIIYPTEAEIEINTTGIS